LHKAAISGRSFKAFDMEYRGEGLFVAHKKELIKEELTKE